MKMGNKLLSNMTIYQFLFTIFLVIVSGQKTTSFGTDSGKQKYDYEVRININGYEFMFVCL